MIMSPICTIAKSYGILREKDAHEKKHSVEKFNGAILINNIYSDSGQNTAS